MIARTGIFREYDRPTFSHVAGCNNVTIEEKVAKSNHYPFKSYKVSKLHRATAKRAIGKAEIFRIINYASDRPYVRLAVDLFAFSYYMGGINFVDMAYLTQQNIVEDRLIYIRRKEYKMIKLPSLSQAMEIVVRNRRDQSPYLFPILSFYHTTEQQRRNCTHKVIAKINLFLKLINKELNISINLTPYVARHSFATALKRSGVSITNDPHTVPADYKAGQTL